jgi:hypothetical protein
LAPHTRGQFDPGGEFVLRVGYNLGGRHGLDDAGVVVVLAPGGEGG